MLEVADVVTVPSEELARHLPVPAVVVRDGIAPPPGWSRFYGPLLPRRGECVEIAWYGMAGSGRAPSGMRDLLQIAPVLERLSGEFPLRLTVISNSREAWEKEIRPLGLPTRYLEWGSHGRFCGLLPRHDLCLIPVNRNPYTLCKSNNRLALSLYLGVPVVADAIPSYREFEPFCVLDDWEGGLRRYLGSAEARQADAAAGQQYVRERYGVERAAADWWSLFERLLAGEESGTRAVQAAGVSA